MRIRGGSGRTGLVLALVVAATALSGCGMFRAGDTSARVVTGSGSATSAGPTTIAPAPTGPGTRPSASPTAPATPTSAGTPAGARTVGTAKPSAPSPTPAATPTAKKAGDTLNPGDSGPYVQSVQQRLSDLGYWNGVPDGSFGQLTVQAVMALQKAAGLGRDGVFGPSTRRALDAGIRPTSQVGGDGVEIDKARQLLLVVRGGRVTTILNTSTGSGQHYSYQGADYVALTPSGTFSVFRTVDHLDKGPLGDLWRPRYFNGGIAVHGAAAIPGYPASHGCARVSDPAMDMIWAQDLMPVGSRVVVY